MWTIFNVGYYLLLPIFVKEISYNSSPFIIAIYYLVCSIITVSYFRKTYDKWFELDSKILSYIFISLGLSTLLWLAIYLYLYLPVLHGPSISAFTDIILATPRYFIPKSIEILVQQLLVSVLVLELHLRFESIKEIMIGYLICFGGAHVVLFFLNGAPIIYSTTMTVGAIFSSLIFPYLILKVRGGFIYAYVIHFSFYIALAVLFHVLPPPGYIF